MLLRNNLKPAIHTEVLKDERPPIQVTLRD